MSFVTIACSDKSDSAAVGKSGNAVVGKWVGYPQLTDEDFAKMGIETEEDKKALQDQGAG